MRIEFPVDGRAAAFERNGASGRAVLRDALFTVIVDGRQVAAGRGF